MSIQSLEYLSHTIPPSSKNGNRRRSVQGSEGSTIVLATENGILDTAHIKRLHSKSTVNHSNALC